MERGYFDQNLQKLQLQFLQHCALLGLALKKESVGHSVVSNYLWPYGL